MTSRSVPDGQRFVELVPAVRSSLTGSVEDSNCGCRKRLPFAAQSSNDWMCKATAKAWEVNDLNLAQFRRDAELPNKPARFERKKPEMTKAFAVGKSGGKPLGFQCFRAICVAPDHHILRSTTGRTTVRWGCVRRSTISPPAATLLRAQRDRRSRMHAIRIPVSMKPNRA